MEESFAAVVFLALVFFAAAFFVLDLFAVDFFAGVLPFRAAAPAFPEAVFLTAPLSFAESVVSADGA